MSAISYWRAWQQADRNVIGTEARAYNLIHKHGVERTRDVGNGAGLLKYKAHFQWHDYSTRATAPNLS